MDSIRRLRIANRIRIVLQRELGVTIDVSLMLRQRSEASEVLFACKGLGTAELISLSAQFEAETRAEDAARLRALAASEPVAGNPPRHTGWATLSSSFGASKPPSGWGETGDSVAGNTGFDGDEPPPGPPARMVMHTQF